MTETTKTYRVHGTTDDVTTCTLCGREELKSTVILALLDESANEVEITYMGSDCAARAAGWTQTKVNKDAKSADRAAHDKAERERDMAARVERDETRKGFLAWLDETYATRDENKARLIHKEKFGVRLSPYRLSQMYRSTLSAA